MKSRLHAHIGTFRQLEILLSVYEFGSIKAASEVLFLAQPTISMQLKKLSTSIGIPLYDQVGKKIVFTEAGLTVVKRAREVLHTIDELDMELSELRGFKKGHLKIAVVTTAKYFIPHLLGPFCSEYPGIDIELKVGNRKEIIQRLEQRHDDFYIFSHPPENMDTDSIEFLKNPLVACVSNKNPLAKQKEISLKEFAKQPFIMREMGSGTRFAIERFMKKHNTELNVKMTIESNEAIKHTVIANLGVSILSRHTLSLDDKDTGLKQINVEHLPIKTSWYFLWPKKKRVTIIGKEFLNYVQAKGQKVLKVAKN